MDRELDITITRQNRRKRLRPIIAGLLLLLSVLYLIRRALYPTVRLNEILTFPAERGDLIGTLTAIGVVVPEFEQLFTSPIESKIEKIRVPAGETVRADSSILELNISSASLSLAQLCDELDLKINRQVQLRLRLERLLVDLEAQCDIKKLEIEYLLNQFNLQQRLFDIGVGTQEEYAKADLNLKIARRELTQLQKTISSEQKGLKADLRELELQIAIQRKSIETLQRQIEAAAIRSDRDGVVTWVRDEIGAAVMPGERVARVADLASFKIQAKISDVHVARLIPGNPVIIRFEKTDLDGTIASIEPTIQNGVVTFNVTLSPNNHPLLRPNLRVEVYVVTSSLRDIIRVKNGPFINGGGEQEIFVIGGGRAWRRTVLIGEMNYDWVEIRQGLQPGEIVIISNTREYLHRPWLQLKIK